MNFKGNTLTWKGNPLKFKAHQLIFIGSLLIWKGNALISKEIHGFKKENPLVLERTCKVFELISKGSPSFQKQFRNLRYRER